MLKKIKNTTKQLNTFFFLCGIVMLSSEIWKQFYLTDVLSNGIYQWWYFPFQLCSIAMYIILFLPWLSEGPFRKALLCFLACYNLLGGIAVFADTSGLHYPALCLTIHSFSWHILLIVTGVLAAIELCRECKDKTDGRSGVRHTPFFHATLIYLACCLTASLINLLVTPFGKINMFYINPNYDMQQIAFEKLVPVIGNHLTIALYMAFTILGAWILYEAILGIKRITQKENSQQ